MYYKDGDDVSNIHYLKASASAVKKTKKNTKRQEKMCVGPISLGSFPSTLLLKVHFLNVV